MADREGQRAARKQARTPPGASGARAPRAARSVADLQRENAALAAELAAARARIAELERVCDHVVNRIDWVVDSIHNVVES